MSMNLTGASAQAERRLPVPWATVALLAGVMAYADGFWLTSLQGAIGAVERAQGPFANWLRVSTLMLPLFVLGVYKVLTSAQRRYGPELRGARMVLATGLLVVAAGTVVGVAALAVNSALDYHVQAGQAQLMNSMRSMDGMVMSGTGMNMDRLATLAVHVRAVSYASVLLLGTNLLLVGWVVALRGGRLDVSATGRRARTRARTAARPSTSAATIAAPER
jgi:hypothetical protein